MAFKNYVTSTLRASAATSGANEQDAAVTLPESVSSFWVVVDKTAEANADNTLTVRLQAKVGSTWFDLSWDSITTSAAITADADSAAVVVRTPNILDSYTASATVTVLAHYKEVPSNVVRVISISTGTAVANTFSVVAAFPMNNL